MDQPIVLSDIQVRVLGSLAEKKETTPDQYPLTLNALRNACNQKTSRHPVSRYEAGEIGHTLRELEAMHLVREIWGARAHRYEHRLDKTLDLTGKELAVLCPLMLRGPQTSGEIRTNAQRLYQFDDLDDVQAMLRRLQNKQPPLLVELPRQAGQKEERFAHLLAGEPTIDAPAAARPTADGGLEDRVAQLEQEVAAIRDMLKQFNDPAGDT